MEIRKCISTGRQSSVYSIWIPVEHVVPAEEHPDDEEDETDEKYDDTSPEDELNQHRLLDDSFENLEIVVKKYKEIETLKKSIKEKDSIIKELENKPSGVKKDPPLNKNINLPNLYQKIRVKLIGENRILAGKVIRNPKKKSVHRTLT